MIDHFSDAVVQNPIVGKTSQNPALREWHTKQLGRLVCFPVYNFVARLPSVKTSCIYGQPGAQCLKGLPTRRRVVEAAAERPSHRAKEAELRYPPLPVRPAGEQREAA